MSDTLIETKEMNNEEIKEVKEEVKEIKEVKEETEDILRKEIKQLSLQITELETVLEDKQQQLLIMGFSRLLNVDIATITKYIDNLCVSIDENEVWEISYRHKTDTYSSNNYALSDEELDEVEDTFNEIDIKFGRDKKYYIKGGPVKFQIYKNSNGVLRIINQDYEMDLDVKEQEHLIDKYCNNFDIVEWFALRVMNYMSKNNWNDNDLTKYICKYID